VSALPSHDIDLDLQKVVLDVVNRKIRGLDTRVEGSIVGGELERTIDGASTLTLTVHDPQRALLRSGMFDYRIDVHLDRLYWRLVKVGKSGDDLTLSFEDREVAYLRDHTSPRKATRGKVTRPQFAQTLVREVRPTIPFVTGAGVVASAPPRPIASSAQKRSDASRAEQRQQGLNRKTPGLTVKGAPASPDQVRMAERVLDVAASLNAPEKAAQALVAACIVESLLRNPNGGDRDSRGVLQVRDSTARPMRINNLDPEACANAFLTRGFTGRGGAITLARQHPDWTAGQIAQTVQGSAHPTRYDEWGREAAGVVNAYTGGEKSDAQGTIRVGEGGSTLAAMDTRVIRKALPYQFRRGGTDGQREDSWTCLQRLASEVNWRCFMSAGTLYFISEDELMRAKPRFVISEDTLGVSAIDFDIDRGKVRDEVTVTCRAARWTGAPGAVIELFDCGPANGRWLVSDLRRGIFDADATITLKRPSKALPEPPAETVSQTATSKQAIAAGMTSGSPVERAYAAAKAMDAKRLPYVWGGGHSRAGVADGGTGRDPGVGFDCSGSTVAILAAAGMGFSPGGGTATSGSLTSWGEPGPGKGMTLYANSEHVFLVFHDVGKAGDEHFGTGRWGKSWGGAGFNPNMHPTAGFVARHWPGS